MSISKRFLELILLGILCVLIFLPVVFSQSSKSNELVRLGIAEADLGKKLFLFEKAVNEDARNYVALNNLATCYEMRKDFDRAIQFYQQAFQVSQALGKKFPDPCFGLGDVFLARKEFKNAWECYQAGLQLQPDDCETKQKLENMKKEFPQYFNSKGEFLLVDADQIIAKLTPTRGMKVKPRVDLVVEFDYNSDKIDPQAQKQIENLANAMKSPNLANHSFTLAGHTDSRGSDSYNKALSERRAKALLKKIVQEYSVDENRLFAVGYGKDHLKVKNENSEDDFRRNRRVEIILGKEE